MIQLSKLKSELHAKANPEKAKILSGFFKTGPGEYGEGDLFLGITVPEQRKIVKQFRDLDLSDIEQLIQSPIHEERLTGLLILVEQYHVGRIPAKRSRQTQKSSSQHQGNNNLEGILDSELGSTTPVILDLAPGSSLSCHPGRDPGSNIYNFYIQHFDHINNWDLVDLTAPKIVGVHLLTRDRSVLKNWAKSNHLWTRRIAIVATHHFIRQNQFEDTLQIAAILLHDSHDLIHKAVGWMLREVGKRDQSIEETFLKKHYQTMPRTMLRYAIERFPETLRQQYLKGLL